MRPNLPTPDLIAIWCEKLWIPSVAILFMVRCYFRTKVFIFLNTYSLLAYGQQILLPAPKILSLTASNPSTASGDISFYSNGCQMTITFDTNTDTGNIILFVKILRRGHWCNWEMFYVLMMNEAIQSVVLGARYNICNQIHFSISNACQQN
jgi:hypothetical protein